MNEQEIDLLQNGELAYKRENGLQSLNIASRFIDNCY